MREVREEGATVTRPPCPPGRSRKDTVQLAVCPVKDRGSRVGGGGCCVNPEQ